MAGADGADPSYDEDGRGNGVGIGVVGTPVKGKGKEARIYPVRMPDSPLPVHMFDRPFIQVYLCVCNKPILS